MENKPQNVSNINISFLNQINQEVLLVKLHKSADEPVRLNQSADQKHLPFYQPAAIPDLIAL